MLPCHRTERNKIRFDPRSVSPVRNVCVAERLWCVCEGRVCCVCVWSTVLPQPDPLMSRRPHSQSQSKHHYHQRLPAAQPASSAVASLTLWSALGLRSSTRSVSLASAETLVAQKFEGCTNFLLRFVYKCVCVCLDVFPSRTSEQAWNLTVTIFTARCTESHIWDLFVSVFCQKLALRSDVGEGTVMHGAPIFTVLAAGERVCSL